MKVKKTYIDVDDNLVDIQTNEIDKQTIDSLIDVLQAYKEDKIIEYRLLSDKQNRWAPIWNLAKSELWNLSMYEFRIKPEPETRPYLSTEEFIKNAIMHNNWIKSPYGDMLLPVNVDPTRGEVMFTDERGNIGACHCYWKSFEKLLDEDYRWFDDNTVLGEFE